VPVHAKGKPKTMRLVMVAMEDAVPQMIHSGTGASTPPCSTSSPQAGHQMM